MNGHPLDAIVEAQHRGEPRGITSVCSANPTVLEATVRHGVAGDGPVLIEATCNQVNQYGGYTGMTAAGFPTLREDWSTRTSWWAPLRYRLS
jgi:D-tagatose-1,6-bisphosphate aldolase subunit GatZ/KbaZ